MIKGEMRFDVRIVERNVRKGLTTQDEVAKHLSHLKDKTDNAAIIEAVVGKIAHEIPVRGLEDEEDDL